MWDLVVVNGSWMFRPTLQPVSAPGQLNESMSMGLGIHQRN